MVTGANGISGFHTLRALLDSPQRWSKIYAVSRRPPPEGMMALLTEEQRAKVEHVASDFLKSPEDIAEAIKRAGVKKVDCKCCPPVRRQWHIHCLHSKNPPVSQSNNPLTNLDIFFYSYLQPPPPPGQAAWSNADELVRVNSALLSNFLSALPLASLSPKRFLLQTGAKNYGVHLGRARNPAVESDPQPSHLGPNFYYPQEKALFEYCDAHPETRWNIVMPAWIIGATNNAQMNALHPFAIYAAVAAKRNIPLAFPSNFDAWTAEQHHSCARLTGYLSEWAVLEEKCANQRFNSQDTSPVTMDRFFEELARWFGVEKGVKPPPDSDENMMPVAGGAGKDAPMGYGPPVVNKFAFSLTGWAKEKENQEAWREMIRESGGKLKHDPFEDVEANFTFGDGAFIRVGCLGMNKARRLGWTGFVDTLEGVFEMYEEMGPKGLGMVPGMRVDGPKALV